MKNEEIVHKTAMFVQDRLKNEPSGHDWWHVRRVWKCARVLAEKEKADMFAVELAALLHDIADWKFQKNGDIPAGETVRNWLGPLGVSDRIIDAVNGIIASVSFKGSGVASTASSKEAMVVQDADRLDALGAIGIARAFSYGGYKNRAIHDPDCRPKEHATFDEYKNSRGTTINHFHEKLLLLKDRLHTPSAKEIAYARHRFLEQFLEQFYREWNSDDI